MTKFSPLTALAATVVVTLIACDSSAEAESAEPETETAPGAEFGALSKELAELDPIVAKMAELRAAERARQVAQGGVRVVVADGGDHAGQVREVVGHRLQRVLGGLVRGLVGRLEQLLAEPECPAAEGVQ